MLFTLFSSKTSHGLCSVFSLPEELQVIINQLFINIGYNFVLQKLVVLALVSQSQERERKFLRSKDSNAILKHLFTNFCNVSLFKLFSVPCIVCQQISLIYQTSLQIKKHPVSKHGSLVKLSKFHYS